MEYLCVARYDEVLYVGCFFQDLGDVTINVEVLILHVLVGNLTLSFVASQLLQSPVMCGELEIDTKLSSNRLRRPHIKENE